MSEMFRRERERERERKRERERERERERKALLLRSLLNFQDSLREISVIELSRVCRKGEGRDSLIRFEKKKKTKKKDYSTLRNVKKELHLYLHLSIIFLFLPVDPFIFICRYESLLIIHISLSP